MSAPAGWHLQPDGQERYWDGSRWTDEFRDPLPSDPTAPPADTAWEAPVDQTQALDVDSTQQIPAPVPPPGPDHGTPQGYPQQGYPQQGYPQQGYPQQQPGYPQTGYGAAGSQPYAPPPRSGNGLATGCLIVAIIGVLLVGAAVVAGIYVFNRASETISENFPTDLPTDLPSGFPSDLPTEGLGQSIDVTVGAGFELPRATIEPGWSLDPAAGSVVNITGMRAMLGSADGFPVLFTMSFPATGGGDDVQTLCTTATGSSDSTVDVSCVPLFGDVAGATTAKVTASL